VATLGLILGCSGALLNPNPLNPNASNQTPSNPNASNLNPSSPTQANPNPLNPNPSNWQIGRAVRLEGASAKRDATFTFASFSCQDLYEFIVQLQKLICCLTFKLNNLTGIQSSSHLQFGACMLKKLASNKSSNHCDMEQNILWYRF